MTGVPHFLPGAGIKRIEAVMVIQRYRRRRALLSAGQCNAWRMSVRHRCRNPCLSSKCHVVNHAGARSALQRLDREGFRCFACHRSLRKDPGSSAPFERSHQDLVHHFPPEG